MKNYQFIMILLFPALSTIAQVQDNFSDGNLANPDWSGTTSQFIINASQQLQLSNTTAGTSYLSTPFQTDGQGDLEWQVYVRQSFAPSASNYGRVYLTSSESDLTQPLQGYYLQFGEAGANDAVQLFRQTGTTSTAVCRARNGAIAASFGVRVKVLRDNTGSWEIWIDYAGGTAFSLEATGNDPNLVGSLYFGFLCVYTSSNASKFFYDDVYAGLQKRDITPPVCLAVKVSSANSLSLTFSESLDTVSATRLLNYSAGDVPGHPVSAVMQKDSNRVILNFTPDFPNGLTQQLSVSGVRDPAGNEMTAAQFPFLYFLPAPIHPKDIIFTELLPDPSPPIGLPEAEYVELYNASNNPVSLDGWKISDGSTTGTFPFQIILPGEFVITTALSNASLFVNKGKVVSPTSFPSLNNSSDTLILITPQGLTIDSLNYDLTWYHDTDKQDGGWSLELIDPGNPCGEESNWTASEDPAGGTPGKINAVNASKPDLTGPSLVALSPVKETRLLLTFSEKLSTDAPVSGRFELTPAISFAKVYFSDHALRQIIIELDRPLMPRQLYRMSVTGVMDCNGNEILEDYSAFGFALPERADPLDVVINEVLFNPRPNGTDFVEVYNHSPKYLNLRNWKMANREGDILKNVSPIASQDIVFPPGSYWVFTADGGLLKSNYPQGKEENFHVCSLPPLPDDEGSIVLIDDQGRVIDYFLYDRRFHSPILKDDEGVSLERISFSDPTNESQNWKSAASQAGYATPGYLNSNARAQNFPSRGQVSVEPEIFAPGVAGSDFAKINYSFDRPGYIANIRILDQQGRLIKTISNNETLGYEGFFRWDGDRDDGSGARIGYYVVWIEVFDLSGTVNTFRKRAVVATK